MNARPKTAIIRLAAGASRTGIRWLSAQPKQPYQAYEEHAEKIFVIRHIERNHVVYSFTPTLSPSLIKRQIPFNGKKLYPATIRKDYWDTMAVIEFPEGQGEVGRSVFQRLREFRKRHELEWEEPLFELSRRERGVALNNQRANSIADIAAVLAGAGKGNLIVAENKKLSRNETIRRDKAAKAESKAAKAAGVPAQEADAAEGATPTKTLSSVTVYWQDIMDSAYAQSWSDNVSHATLEPNMLGQTYRRKSKLREEAEAQALVTSEQNGEGPKQATAESV
ncbi:hypothetical protein GQ53DRAFT_804603 [Thozetella sp. PMI_491]|nr:hypothetical protein GQ53DRAFT_804603 [Thozetella sp. PMI_491]